MELPDPHHILPQHTTRGGSGGELVRSTFHSESSRRRCYSTWKKAVKASIHLNFIKTLSIPNKYPFLLTSKHTLPSLRMQSFALSSPKSIFTPSRAFIQLFPKPYHSLQFSCFTNMNRTGERGWFSNTQQSFSSSSESGEPHHQNQGHTSKSDTRKNTSELYRPPSDSAIRENRQGAWGRVPQPQLINLHDQEAPIVGCSSKQHRHLPTSSDDVNASGTEQQISAATSSESGMGQSSSAPEDGSPPQSDDSLHCAAQPVNKVRSSKRGQDIVRGHKSPEHSGKAMPQPRSTSSRMEYASVSSIHPVVRPSTTDQNAIKGHRNVELSKREIFPHRKSPPKRECSNHSPEFVDDMPFDLFLKKHKAPILKASLYEKNHEKRKNLERSLNDPRPNILRPGMVLLKNFISLDDQIKILKKCRDTGLGIGGFYQPGYKDGAKLHLHMMCLGKDWDPQTRSYAEYRSLDSAKPPIIPDEFRKLVGDAIEASNAMIRDNGVKYPDKAIPLMEPDICIVNFYSNTGKLGLHQDKDESDESLKKLLPVVSFSIGDSAEFLYGDDRDVDKAKKIELKSGDVLIFGGESRNIFHGVLSIIPKTAPKFLVDEDNLRPGRLNLTFRKY